MRTTNLLSTLCNMIRYVAALFVVHFVAICAHSETFALSLKQAQQDAVTSSWRLKAAGADVSAALAQENAGYAGLFPRLSLQANYTFLSTLPEVRFGAAPAATFGDHNNYSIGPQLTYTLWDTFASFKNYHALTKIRESREQDRKSAQLQLLLAVRLAYVRVQLALEELRLVASSLDLANKQANDIKNRVNAGAATELDTLTSKRHVSSFKLIFDQKQADLSVALKELLALTGDTRLMDISRPGSAGLRGPEGLRSVTLVLNFDSLTSTVQALEQQAASAPDEEHPQIKSQELLKQSSEFAAESLRSKLFPTLQLSLSTALIYPNGPQLINTNQTTIGLSFSVPLYLGDPTWELIEQRRSEARASHYRSKQTQRDLHRDYDKAQQLLISLKAQRRIAEIDVADAERVAKLYYASFLGGKFNLIDVQSANNDALQSRVNVARIDAQIINQLISLMALSGKEYPHE